MGRAATNAMAMVATQALAVAMMWRVTKWEMAKATRAIVTKAVATVAAILASAVTAAAIIAAAAITIAQHHCPQCSHCSGYCNPPPLRHPNQTNMVWVMAMEAMATAKHHCSCCPHCPPLRHHNTTWAMATAKRFARKQRQQQWQ